jgi:hypothetical protein
MVITHTCAGSFELKLWRNNLWMVLKNSFSIFLFLLVSDWLKYKKNMSLQNDLCTLPKQDYSFHFKWPSTCMCNHHPVLSETSSAVSLVTYSWWRLRYSPVGQLKQLHSFWSCPITDLVFRNCYSNITLLKLSIGR